MCGTMSYEWEENRNAYSPSETFCKGCYLKEVASEDVQGLPGTTVSLIPTTSLEYKSGLIKMKKNWAARFEGDI